MLLDNILAKSRPADVTGNIYLVLRRSRPYCYKAIFNYRNIFMKNTKTREGFEWWDSFCAIPTYMFALHEEDGIHSVRKVPNSMGTHIEQHAASEIVDAMQDEINDLKTEVAALRKRLKLKAL